MSLNETNGQANNNSQDSVAVFSTIDYLTPDQKTMIAQRITSVLKSEEKIPGEVGENGKAKKIKFSKLVRDDVNPLLKKGAGLAVGGFNSVHETIYERGGFIYKEVDPVLSKWNISFRWFSRTVAEICGIQSRGSWNNHRIIFKAFGEKLKTDPYVRALAERKLLICAKHDDPMRFVNSSIDRIQKCSQLELEELVTGNKRQKREPNPDRSYKLLKVRAYWNEEREELRLKGMTPDLLETIYDLLEDQNREAEEMDSALSTLLDDGSFDWTPYWIATAENSEITISYTAGEAQHTFWTPEKGQVPYQTWAEVIEAVRAENPEAYVIMADGPEHKIAETSLATNEPQTYVTIPKEVLESLTQRQKEEELSELDDVSQAFIHHSGSYGHEVPEPRIIPSDPTCNLSVAGSRRFVINKARKGIGHFSSPWQRIPEHLGSDQAAPSFGISFRCTGFVPPFHIKMFKPEISSNPKNI